MAKELTVFEGVSWSSSATTSVSGFGRLCDGLLLLSAFSPLPPKDLSASILNFSTCLYSEAFAVSSPARSSVLNSGIDAAPARGGSVSSTGAGAPASKGQGIGDDSNRGRRGGYEDDILAALCEWPSMPVQVMFSTE